MPNFDKWIKRESDSETARQVAVRSIGDRLKAVELFLPLAAYRAHEDVEFVHQLRVSTRRSVAAMDLYQELLPNRQSKWVRKQLKKVRRAAGQARDLDVLSLAHQKEDRQLVTDLLKSVQKRRAKAQRPIQQVYQDLTHKQCFATRQHKLLSRVAQKRQHREAEQLFDEFARIRLLGILDDFFELSVHNTTDLSALHRFRISGKELRYAMELLSPAFPNRFRNELYPIIEQLQDRLGEINDHAVASRRFGRWLHSTRKKRKIAGLRKLMQDEQVDLEKALERYAKWWTKKYAKKVRRGFDEVIAKKSRSKRK